VAWINDDMVLFRCDLAVGFFAAVSLAGFLPAIGISISFWPADVFLDFLAGFPAAFDSVAAPKIKEVSLVLTPAHAPRHTPRDPLATVS
jgi:hypothetical protein